ncbi:MAG: serine/threonine protein kinase [Chromatiales bacterium]|nr:serine/threonine protein kinase [Chromatiales bacterium]
MNLPQRIGKYHVKSLLGQGAMGIVYLAHDPDIDRSVAIKVLHPQYDDPAEGRAMQDRFRREAQAAARCLHSNIVAVFDLGVDAGRNYIVMEYVRGEALRYFLKNDYRFSLGESLHIIAQVLEGLAVAHRFGVVHRDIKPANIILLDSGAVKVADFGVARVAGSDLTLDGNMIGTPSYMSPEGLRGQTVDQRADLYSAGMVLLELLTGARPVPQDLYTQPVSVFVDNALGGERGRVLPQGVGAMLHRALADHREQRYPDAATFLAALRHEQAELTTPESAETTLADTVVSRRPLVAPQPVGEPMFELPPEVLDKLEQSLVSHIGPMAKMLMRKTGTGTLDPEAFIQSLAQHISNPHERAEFLDKARRCLREGCGGSVSSLRTTATVGTSTMAEQLSPQQVDRLANILAGFVGPVALQLVRKRARETGNAGDLHRLLASAIPNPDEKRRFLGLVGD